MKTIQDYLKECNRDEVIGIYLYDYAFNNSLMGKEYKDISIGELTDRIKTNVNNFIDKLINIEPKKSKDDMVIFAAYQMSNEKDDVDFMLVKKSDLNKEGWINSYSLILIPFEEAMTFYVADTYLTQYYINDLLSYFLHEISFFGYEQEDIDKVTEELNKSVEEAKKHADDENYFKSFDDFMKEMEEKYSFEREKKDSRQEDARRNLYNEINKYNEYCQKLEIEKIKATL